MSKLNSFFTATIWYSVANVTGQGIIMLGNIIFTRIMSQNDYGLYSTYYSFVSLLIPFVGCNLYLGLKNGYIDFKEDRKRFRACVFLLSVIVFLLFSTFSITITYIYNIIAKHKLAYFIIIMALVHAYSFFVVSFFNNYENMENNYKTKSVLLIVPNLFQVILPLIIMYFLNKRTYNERIAGSTLGIFLCALFCAMIMLKGQKKLLTENYYRYAIRISVPSILSSVSGIIMHQSDHLMITAFCGATFTAVYSFAYLIGNAVYAFFQAANGALQSWIYRLLDSMDFDNIYAVQKWYLLFFLFLSYSLLMVSPELIKLLAPESYWDFRFIPPFVLGSSVSVINGMYGIIGEFHKKAGALSRNVFIAAITNIILNVIFINLLGSIAAAYTSFAAYFLLMILNRKLSEKLQKGFFLDKYFIFYILSITAGSVLFAFTANLIIIRYILFLLLLLCILLYVYIKRNELSLILKANKKSKI